MTWHISSEVITEKSSQKIVQKSKTTPFGSYAVPSTSTSLLDVNTPWLTLADTLRTACLDYDEHNVKYIKELLAVPLTQ